MTATSWRRRSWWTPVRRCYVALAVYSVAYAWICPLTVAGGWPLRIVGWSLTLVCGVLFGAALARLRQALRLEAITESNRVAIEVITELVSHLRPEPGAVESWLAEKEGSDGGAA
jgi:hypothetical protein